MRKTILTLLILISIAATATAWDGICPICKSENRKSKVHRGMCSTTLLHCGNGYYDEEGYFHSPPNCNRTSCGYRCSNGHDFSDDWFAGKLDEGSVIEAVQMPYRKSDRSHEKWGPMFRSFSTSTGARNGK